MFDFFAAYDLVSDKLYLVPSSVLRENHNCISLRVVKPKNNQITGVHMADGYLATKVLT
jgi:hypothetical protein